MEQNIGNNGTKASGKSRLKTISYWIIVLLGIGLILARVTGFDHLSGNADQTVRAVASAVLFISLLLIMCLSGVFAPLLLCLIGVSQKLFILISKIVEVKSPLRHIIVQTSSISRSSAYYRALLSPADTPLLQNYAEG